IAKDILINVKLFPTAAGMPVALDATKNQQELCDHPKPSTLPFDLFPTDVPAERVLSISALPSATATQSVTIPGNKPRTFVGLYVVGCVSYHSSFGTEIHESRFAYHLMGPPPISADGTPLVLPNGMPMFEGFEIGVTVPRDQLGVIQELFARNDAN